MGDLSGTCGTARAEIPLTHTTETLWNLTVMAEESCGAGVSVQYGSGAGDQVSVPAGSATIVPFHKQSPRPQTVVIDCPRGTGDCRFSYQLTHASATNDASVFVQDCANGGATVTLARPGNFFFRIFVDKACGGSADVTIPGQGGPIKAPQLKPTAPDSKASLEIGVTSTGARRANGKHEQIVIDCGTGSDECVYTYEFFETGRRRRRRRRP